jgi:hypothetical protein
MAYSEYGLPLRILHYRRWSHRDVGADMSRQSNGFRIKKKYLTGSPYDERQMVIRTVLPVQFSKQQIQTAYNQQSHTNGNVHIEKRYVHSC